MGKNQTMNRLLRKAYVEAGGGSFANFVKRQKHMAQPIASKATLKPVATVVSAEPPIVTKTSDSNRCLNCGKARRTKRLTCENCGRID